MKTHNAESLSIYEKVQEWCYAMRYVGLLLSMLLFVGVSVVEGVPTKMSYQGKLTDASGVPLNGTYSMTFRVYGVSSGGTALWSEVYDNANKVSVVNGHFSVELGSISGLNSTVFSGGSRYLGIQVENDSEMSPRVSLLSVPYAYEAEKVGGVSGNQMARVDASNVFSQGQYFSGVVGIGTTSSTEKLTVVGNVSVSGTMNASVLSGSHVGDGSGLTNLNASELSGGVIPAARITGVGTVTSGVWQGTPVGVSYGGTGASNAASARSNLGAVSKTGDTLSGVYTLSSGSLTVPSFVASTANVTSITGTNINGTNITGTSITGTTISGSFVGDGSQITALDANNITGQVGVSKGGTGASTAAGARSNLGVVSKTGDTLSGVYTLSSGSLTVPSFVATTVNATQITGTRITGTFYGDGSNLIGVQVGSLTGTIPVSQGGTGAIDAAGARSNLGVVNKAGDTMTGGLTATSFSGDGSNLTNLNAGELSSGIVPAARITGVGTVTSGVWQGTPVGVSYGGTGASDAATARSNLGAVSKTGDTLSGVYTLSSGSLSAPVITGTTVNATKVVGTSINGTTLTGSHVGDGSSLTNLNASQLSSGTIPSARITGVGTVTSGVWQGNAVDVAYGGTGASDAATARTNLGAVSKTGDTLTGVYTLSSGSLSVPSLTVVNTANATGFVGKHVGDGSGLTNLTATNVTGLIPISKGGTNASTSANARTNLGAVSKTGDTLSGVYTLNSGSLSLPSNGLAVGTTQLVVSGAKVGIGKTNPAVALDVVGAVNVGTTLTAASLTGDGSGVTNVAADPTLFLSAVPVSKGGTGVTSLPLFKANLNLGTLADLNSITENEFSGNLKINQGGTGATTSANARTNLGAVSKIGDTMTGTLNLPSNGLNVGTNQLAFNGGNVGIGTTLPGVYKVNVVGTVNATGYVGTNFVGTTFVGKPIGDGSSLTNLNANQLSSGVVPSARITGVSTITSGVWQGSPIDVAYGGTGASTTANIRANIGAVSKGGDTMTGVLNLPTDGLSVGTNQMAFNGGNVGIGTTLPGVYKLSVVGTVNATGYVGNGAALTNLTATNINGLIPISKGGTNASTSANARLNLGAVNKAGDSMTGTLTLPSNGLAVGTTQLVVSGAKVGIGKSNPTVALDVVGAVNVGTTLTAASLAGDGAGVTNVAADPTLFLSAVPVTKGGTGVTSIALFKANLNLGTLADMNSITETEFAGNLKVNQGGTGATTSANARLNLGAVNKAGDTMTGTLNLPSNGLSVGTNQLAFSGGNIGVGTTQPGVFKVNVVGTVNATGFVGNGSALTNVNPNNFSAVVPIAKGGTGTGSSITGMVKGNGAGTAYTGVTGTGSYVAKWTDANTIGTSSIYDDGTTVYTTIPVEVRKEDGSMLIGTQTSDGWTNANGILGFVGTSTVNKHGQLAYYPTQQSFALLDSSGTTAGADQGALGLGRNYVDLWAGDGVFKSTLAIGTAANPNGMLTIRTATSNSLKWAVQVQNPDGTDAGGSAVGILFGVEPNATFGKGALVYERKAGYGRGSFHFLQNAVADGSVPALTQAVMTIQNNGNVGIGKTNPGTALDVNGTVTATGFSGNGSGLTSLSATSLSGQVPIANGGTGATSTASARTALGVVSKAGDTMSGTLTLPSNGLAVGTTQLVVSGTRVGVGKNNPGVALDVVGVVKASSGVDTGGGPKTLATTNVVAGSGISVSGGSFFGTGTNLTVSHGTVAAAATTTNVNGRVLRSIGFDSFGHVTSLGSVDLDTRYPATDFAAGMIQDWTNGTNATGTWLAPTLNYGVVAYAPAAGRIINGAGTIDFTSLPSGTKSAYMSFNANPAGGYVDVYGLVPATATWKHLSRINTYSPFSGNASNNTDGNRIALVATKLDGFSAIRLSNQKGVFRFTGLGFSKEDRKAVENGFMHWDNITGNPFVYDSTNTYVKTTNKLGVGTGITIPATTVHVKGNAGAVMLEGTDHIYTSYYPQGAAGGRKAYIGIPAAGSSDLFVANEVASGKIKLETNSGVVWTNGKVGVGTSSPGTVGGAMLELYGVENSITAGPHIQAIGNLDTYPVYQQLNWGHNNVAMSFDSYWDGANWRTSYANSSFQIYKISDRLSLNYAPPAAQGSIVSFVQGITLTPTGAVGIGVLSPRTQFQVNGSALFNGDAKAWAFGGSSGAQLGVVKTASTYPQIIAASGVPIILGHSNATDLIATAVGSQTLTPRMIINTAGQVGIATVNPSVAFEVNGQARISYSGNQGLTVRRKGAAAAGTGAEIYFDRTDAGANQRASVGMDGDTARDFYINVAGNDRVAISDAGRTLIRGPLVVNEGIDGGGSRGIYTWNDGDTNWGIYVAQSGALKSFSGGTAGAGDGFTGHALRIRTSTSVAQGVLFENASEQVNFSVRSSDGYTYVRGNLYVAGSYLNLNTLSFAAPANDASPVIAVRTVPATQGGANNGAGDARSELILFHGNDPGTTGAGTDFITLRAPAIRFQTYNNGAVTDIANDLGNNTRMKIDENGNVGIGTGSPVNRFEVYDGNMHMNGNSIFLRTGTTDQYDLIKWNGSVDKVDIGGYSGVNLGYTSTGGPNAITPLLTVTNGGKVGISITNPGALLTVRSGTTDPGVYDDGKLVYISGEIGSGSSYDGGFEIRHWNNTQGVGIGYNTIYATGYAADQELFLKARGTKPVTVLNNNNTALQVVGNSSSVPALQVYTSFTTNRIFGLELYTDFGSQEVGQSIRFHQGSRYWKRIEATSGGFYFKEGGSDDLVSITAYGLYLATPMCVIARRGYATVNHGNTEVGCPGGFPNRYNVRWDTEDSGNGDSYDGYNGPASNAGNSSIGMSFCCN